MVIENKFIRISLAVILLAVLLITLIFVLPRLAKHKPELTPEKKTSKETGNKVAQLTAVYGRAVKKEQGQFSLLADDPLTNKHIEYRVKIDSETKFERKSIIIPYLLSPTPTETKSPAEYSELIEGMALELTTLSDTKGKEIIAESIVLPRPAYILQGTIKSIENSSLIVDAAPVMETFIMNGTTPQLPKHNTYEVKVDTNTEITSQIETGVKKYSLSDLKKDQMVVIYANADVTKSTQVTAARVEPIL